MSDILFKVLKMMPKVNYCDDDNCNILHSMIGGSDILTIEKFLNLALAKGQLEEIINKKNNIGKTPLHYAIEHNSQGVANLLIKYGADKDIMDINGNSIKWVQEMSGGSKNIKIFGYRKIE